MVTPLGTSGSFPVSELTNQLPMFLCAYHTLTHSILTTGAVAGKQATSTTQHHQDIQHKWGPIYSTTNYKYNNQILSHPTPDAHTPD